MVVPCFKLEDMFETLGGLKEAGEIDPYHTTAADTKYRRRSARLMNHEQKS